MRNALNLYWHSVVRCRTDPPMLVVASGPPFHTFLTATLLAHRYRAKLVLEYRDEWSECPFEWVSKHPDNRRWEAVCLAHADLIIFTTRSQLEHQLATFPTLNRERCLVLPNGWDPSDLPSQKDNPIHRDENKLVLAFIGNFGSLGVPDAFLSDLAIVLSKDNALRARFELHVIGQKSAAANAALDRFPWPTCLKRIDQVPKRDACRLMAEAHGLLLLNPPELARYIPGKLFEYIATSTPIMLYGSGGEVGEILEQLKAGIVVPTGDWRCLAEALNTLGEQTSLHKDVSPQVGTWLEQHTRERVAAETLEVFEKLVTVQPIS